jgi:hypothetical protein
VPGTVHSRYQAAEERGRRRGGGPSGADRPRTGNRRQQPRHVGETRSQEQVRGPRHPPPRRDDPQPDISRGQGVLVPCDDSNHASVGLQAAHLARQRLAVEHFIGATDQLGGGGVGGEDQAKAGLLCAAQHGVRERVQLAPDPHLPHRLVVLGQQSR